MFVCALKMRETCSFFISFSLDDFFSAQRVSANVFSALLPLGKFSFHANFTFSYL